MESTTRPLRIRSTRSSGSGEITETNSVWLVLPPGGTEMLEPIGCAPSAARSRMRGPLVA